MRVFSRASMSANVTVAARQEHLYPGNLHPVPQGRLSFRLVQIRLEEFWQI